MQKPRDAAVLVDNVHKRFGDVHALRGISFAAQRGSVLGVLGPNGAGKTTTVKVLSTLLSPDEGTAHVAGFDVVKEAAMVRRSIMMTGQYAALDETLSGRANIELFGRLMGLRKKAARQRADELIEEFDLTEAARRPVSGYSGGMRRRIDIACGLVVRPSVVFLDEPTTGLDPRSRQNVWMLVESLKRQGITVLLTTQYLEEADNLSDNIIVIDRGTVIAEGTADELKAMAGGSFCEIVPADPNDLPAMLDALGGMVPVSVRSALEPDARSLSIPAPDGTTTLTEAVRRLDQAGIDLEDIGLRRPSLDDVFLQFTGSEQVDPEALQNAPTQPMPIIRTARPAAGRRRAELRPPAPAPAVPARVEAAQQGQVEPPADARVEASTAFAPLAGLTAAGPSDTSAPVTVDPTDAGLDGAVADGRHGPADPREVGPPAAPPQPIAPPQPAAPPLPAAAAAPAAPARPVPRRVVPPPVEDDREPHQPGYVSDEIGRYVSGEIPQYLPLEIDAPGDRIVVGGPLDDDRAGPDPADDDPLDRAAVNGHAADQDAFEWDEYEQPTGDAGVRASHDPRPYGREPYEDEVFDYRPNGYEPAAYESGHDAEYDDRPGYDRPGERSFDYLDMPTERRLRGDAHASSNGTNGDRPTSAELSARFDLPPVLDDDFDAWSSTARSAEHRAASEAYPRHRNDLPDDYRAESDPHRDDAEYRGEAAAHPDDPAVEGPVEDYFDDLTDEQLANFDPTLYEPVPPDDRPTDIGPAIRGPYPPDPEASGIESIRRPRPPVHHETVEADPTPVDDVADPVDGAPTPVGDAPTPVDGVPTPFDDAPTHNGHDHHRVDYPDDGPVYESEHADAEEAAGVPTAAHAAAAPVDDGDEHDRPRAYDDVPAELLSDASPYEQAPRSPGFGTVSTGRHSAVPEYDSPAYEPVRVERRGDAPRHGMPRPHRPARASRIDPPATTHRRDEPDVDGDGPGNVRRIGMRPAAGEAGEAAHSRIRPPGHPVSGPINVVPRDGSADPAPRDDAAGPVERGRPIARPQPAMGPRPLRPAPSADDDQPADHGTFGEPLPPRGRPVPQRRRPHGGA